MNESSVGRRAQTSPGCSRRSVPGLQGLGAWLRGIGGEGALPALIERRVVPTKLRDHRRHDAGERRGKMQIRPLHLDLQAAVKEVFSAHVDLLEAVGGPRAVVIVEPESGPAPAWPGTAGPRWRCRRYPPRRRHRVYSVSTLGSPMGPKTGEVSVRRHDTTGAAGFATESVRMAVPVTSHENDVPGRATQPASGSHCSQVAQVTRSVNTQVPRPSQWSPVVHTWASSHGVPAGAGSPYMHCPAAQVAGAQVAPHGALLSTCWLHVPAPSQASSVQALPSEHGAPAG